MVETAVVDSVATITVRGDLDDAAILERLLAVCGLVDLDLSSRSTSSSPAPDRGSPRALVAVARDAESREYAT